MGVQLFIEFDNPSSSFKSGEVIRGTVNISTREAITVKELSLGFYGIGFVFWSENSSESDQLHRHQYYQYYDSMNDPGAPFHRQIHQDYEHHRGINNTDIYGDSQSSPNQHFPLLSSHDQKASKTYANEETYLHHQMKLPIDQNFKNATTAELLAGTHRIPYSFQLPENIPSTCRFSKGKVSYAVRADLKLKKSAVLTTNVTETALKEFQILGVLNLELISDILRPLELQKKRQFEGILCLCCCTSGGEGKFLMDLRLSRTGFVPGESVLFNLNFKNDTRVVVKQMKANLTRVVTYIAYEKEAKEEHLVSRLKYNSRIMPGSKGTWSDQLNIPQDTYLTDLGGSRVIRIRYTLKITAKASLCRKAIIEVPITVGTVPERTKSIIGS